MNVSAFSFTFLVLVVGLTAHTDMAHGQEEESSATEYGPIRSLFEVVEDGIDADSEYGPIRGFAETTNGEEDTTPAVIEYDEALAASLTPAGLEYYKLMLAYLEAYARYEAAMQNYQLQVSRAQSSAGTAKSDYDSAMAMTSVSSTEAKMLKSKARGYQSVAEKYEAAVQELDVATVELNKIERQLAELRGAVDPSEQERLHQALNVQP
jgi:tetratricopeptide (TPR) repeat protein